MNQPGSPGSDMPPGAALLGREWLGLDEAGDVGTIRFLAQSSFANRHGTIQGGFLAAMLDSATGVRAPFPQARPTRRPDRARQDQREKPPRYRRQRGAER